MFKAGSQVLNQKQKQTLSQSLAMAIKLTELTGNDILSYLQNEALNNPLIDIAVPETCRNYLDDTPLSGTPAASGTSASTVIESTYTGNHVESLYDTLRRQLHMEKGLSPSIDATVQFLISQLDESGFLRIDLDEVRKKYHIPSPLLEKSMAILHSFDPAGIGARTLSECYLLQLQRLNHVPKGLTDVLSRYGDDLIHKRLSTISKEMHFSSDELYDMIHFLQKLSPAPGKLLQADTAVTVYPDLFLTIENGVPVLRYADENIPVVQFHQREYTEYSLMEGDIQRFARQGYSHYKFIQRALAMRKRTLIKVSSFIVQHQLDYFLDGSPLKPLTLKTIAQACHISISTASRTVKNKYMRTQDGIYELKYFLTREFTTTAETPSLSVSYIKHLLVDIIAKEDKDHPYSDYQLERILKSLQIPVARRTITKYRRALTIPDSRYRKKRK